MKQLLIILLLFTIVSCESEDDVMSDILLLQIERTAIAKQKASDLTSLKAIQIAYNQVIDDLKIANIYLDGKTPQYIMKFKLKQSHFSLDISKHIKDSANAIEFEMEVGKAYYDAHSIGDRVVDEFRTGSAILYGSFGDWRMTVVSKKVLS